MRRVPATRALEFEWQRAGLRLVAGVDEVGRGCLAGPVTAAAVILSVDTHIPGLADSKTLPPAARERLCARILASATAWSVASCTPDEIDQQNIHHASLAAMRRAVLALTPAPDALLVDGRFPVPALDLTQRAVVGGDRRSASIAAASIVAKVTRDREMVALHARDPRYGFDQHKGYGTPAHLRAIAAHGLSAAHRRTFRVGAPA